MSNVTIIDGLQFVEFERSYLDRGATALVTILADNIFAVSRSIYEATGCNVRVMITEDGSHIAISPSTNEETAFVIQKSGKLRAARVIQALERAGVGHLSKYAMAKRDDGIWVGELLPPEPAKPKPTAASKKPRKQGLAAMMPKEVAP